MIKMIYASDKNGVIGKDNKLPWRLPSDLTRFRQLTTGCYVVMGRKTYESLPEHLKPLPNRTNIVLSQDYSFKIEHPDVTVLSILRSFLTVAKMPDSPYSDRDIWIIGGAQVYQSCIEHVDEVHHTLLLQEYEGDTKFDFNRYKNNFIMKSEEHCKLPQDNNIEYLYRVWVKR